MLRRYAISPVFLFLVCTFLSYKINMCLEALLNCHLIPTSRERSFYPSKLRGADLAWLQCFQWLFSLESPKLFDLQNPLLQLAWYFTGDWEKSCSAVDRSRIWWCCLIAAARYNLAQDSAFLRCIRLASLSLQITQLSLPSFGIIRLITKMTHAYAYW